MHYDYITSDFHIGHNNIRGWRGMDHFTQDQHDDLVIARYNSVVGPNDRVLILGDVVMGQMAINLPKIERLNGTKYLVPGNHDRNWLGNRKRITETHNWPDKYTAVGLHPVTPGPVEIDGIPGTVCIDHFPYYGDHTGEERFPEWRPEDNGLWLIHGHVHSAYKQSGMQINVGVDAWGGFPIRPSVLADMIAAGSAEIPAHNDWLLSTIGVTPPTEKEQ